MKNYQLECFNCQRTFCVSRNRYYTSRSRLKLKGFKYYCSNECKLFSKKYNSPIIVSCLSCKKEFSKKVCEIKKTSNNFCTKSCAATYNNRTNPKKKRTTFKTTTCKYCSKPFAYKPSQTKGKFCSTKCCGSFRAKNTEKLFYEGKLSDPGTLRATMLKLFESKCSICNLAEWLGNAMPVWVDHIDGCAANNHPSNLRFICPNCDSFNETFGGRNRGKGRKAIGLKK